MCRGPGAAGQGSRGDAVFTTDRTRGLQLRRRVTDHAPFRSLPEKSGPVHSHSGPFVYSEKSLVVQLTVRRSDRCTGKSPGGAASVSVGVNVRT